MKRHGNLWTQLVSFRNLSIAAHNAARGKRGQANVARFLFDRENQLVRLHEELISHTYDTGGYRTFVITEPKRRMISAAPFRDRVVHHALCNVIEPIFDSTFIHDSYACRKRKGTHAAVDRFQQFARRNRYVLKCDLRKFFPTVDHEILKSALRRKIKDLDVLWLVDLIIDKSNAQEEVDAWFPGDDLLTPVGRRRGLPIGNQTSQFFANVLMNSFDHFVSEQLPGNGYIRYVDDFAVFSNDKSALAGVRTECLHFLAARRLRLHQVKSVISRTADGTRFLGYRIFPTHRRLPSDNLVRLRRRLKEMQAALIRGELSLFQIRQRITSWIGHAQHANTLQLRADILGDVSFSRLATAQDTLSD